MSGVCRIILADDHPTFRFGLKQAIQLDSAFEVIGESADGKEALDLIQSTSPEIAVVDWDMPGLDGLEVTRQVRAGSLPTRIVILTMHDGEELVNEAIETGVHAFVLKDHAVEDIIACLHAVREGKEFLSPSVAGHLLTRARRKADFTARNPAIESLTLREREVLAGVSEGMTTKEIAARFGVSPRTVDAHRRNLCEKLELTGSHSLLQFAMEHRELIKNG